MKKRVDVIIYKTIEIEIDEATFDEKFLSEFRTSFYPFKTIDQHIEHLAQLTARGYAGRFDAHERGEFIEGYGRVKDMGIKLVETSEDWDIESSVAI